MPRVLIHAVVMLVLTAFALTTSSLPPLVTTIATRLKMPVSAFGILFAIQFAMFAVAAFSSSWLQRRARLHSRSFVLMGLGVLSLTLLSAPLFRSHASLYLLIVLLGVAGGLVESHGSAVVAALDPGKSGQYLNLSQAFFCLGGVAAPFTIGYLFKTSLEWQQMLELFGGLIAVIAILFGVTKTPEIEERGVDESSGTTGTPVSPRSRGLFALLSLLMFAYTFSESTVVSWLPSLFEITQGLPKVGAAWLLSLFWAGVMTSRISLFFLPRSGSMNRVVAGSLLLSAAALGLLWLWRGSSVSLVLVALAGLAFGPVWPGIVALTRIVDVRSSSAVGVIGIGGLGAAVGPLASGALIGTYGMETVQPILFALAGVQLIVFVLYLRFALAPPRGMHA